MIQIIFQIHGSNFVKCGGQLGVKSTLSSGRCRSGVLYIQIPNLISKGVLRAALITLCPCRWFSYWYT